MKQQKRRIYKYKSITRFGITLKQYDALNAVVIFPTASDEFHGHIVTGLVKKGLIYLMRECCDKEGGSGDEFCIVTVFPTVGGKQLIQQIHSFGLLKLREFREDYDYVR